MKAQIIAERQQVTDIVRQMTEEVFNTMFSRPLTTERKADFQDFHQVVVSQVKLNHGATDIDFYFKFDAQLLLQIAMKVFSEEYIRDNPISEDLACEVANIVCHKVKAYLNEEGFHTEMSFPFIQKTGEDKRAGADEFVNVYFFYLDKDARHKIGVAIGSTVL
jgi:CheY-specific phosphatase CheX